MTYEFTNSKGVVLNIQHFCTHDGQASRTTVFLKGCSLRCKWCCNPESIHPKQELAYNLKKCIGEKECGLCLKECPEMALSVMPPMARCELTGIFARTAASACRFVPPNALYLFGKEMSVDEVLTEVEQDSSFYDESGGGITASGVSACCKLTSWQRSWKRHTVAALTRPLKLQAITHGRSWKKFFPHVDTVMHDHKLTDPKDTRKWCGVDNSRILANFKRAYETFPNIKFIARTP